MSGYSCRRIKALDRPIRKGSTVTEVFELADRIVTEQAIADPVFATAAGIAGHDTRLTDYSPPAAALRADQVRGWLVDLDEVFVDGPDDRLAVAVMRERLGADLALADAGEHLRDINVLASPAQAVREVFAQMPTDTDEDWEVVATRLGAVPAALASLRAAYEQGAARGLLPARRQVLGTARTLGVIAGASGGDPWFTSYVGQRRTDDTLTARLAAGAGAATTAYGELADWLRDTYAPVATETDGVGAERYARWARVWNGADLDLADTYAWGWQELATITGRISAAIRRIFGEDVPPAQAKTRLDADPAHSMVGAEATREWLQKITDDTVATFDGRYFDIPDAIRRCEAMLAPPGGAAAPYYTPPSEDLSRPGRTWLPADGQDRFGTWWLTSVWYHEAVPGHHLQVAYAVVQRERLSRFQRTTFVSGHGEGWALYAERLMEELGYFEDPATELGFLTNQAMRACRIVIDIGLHLGLRIPADLDPALVADLSTDPRGGSWTPELAREVLMTRGMLDERFATSEIDRYLGLPGQAISYKVGERVWLAAREDARAAAAGAGRDFDLKDWHMKALALGPVGLDTLRSELALRA